MFIQIKDESVTLSKDGFVFAEIVQTIPVGCYYSVDEDRVCEESITFEDESHVSDQFSGHILVQNTADVGKSFVKLQVKFFILYYTYCDKSSPKLKTKINYLIKKE